MTDLTEQLQAAIREPELTISLERNLFGGQPLVRLTKPGATSRSKPINLVPVIVGDTETQPHSAIVRMLADMLEKAGR